MNNTMYNGTWFVLILALGAGLPGPGQAAMLRGNVIASGATPSTGLTGSGRVLYATVGQAAVGVSGGSSFLLCAGFWCFGGTRVVAVEDPAGGGDGSRLPLEFALGAPSPTPSHGDVSFSLALPGPAVVSLAVFDVGGRQIGEVASQRLEAGHHRLFWRAPNAKPGVYFGMVRVGGRIEARRRIVLVR